MARTVEPVPDDGFILVREWEDLTTQEQGHFDGCLSQAAVNTQRGNYGDTQDALVAAADIVTWTSKMWLSSLQPPELVAVIDRAAKNNQKDNAALQHFR